MGVGGAPRRVVHRAVHCGVRIRHVNLLKRTVEVVDTLPVLRGRVIEETTKTYERRTIKVSRDLCEELAAYLNGRAQKAC